MTSAAVSIPQEPHNSATVPRGAHEITDHGWVARVMEREAAGILRLLWKILGTEQDVMDAFQDCFCKLATHHVRGGVINPKAYAYRTAANIAVEMIRVRSRRAAHWPGVVAERAEAATEPADEIRPADRLTRLRDAIARLPDHLREVVVLRDLSRFSYAEVGRTLGIEPTTARVYRRHAIVKLAEILGEGDPE
jgi:RNA polymerase sigma-70 factor (ECF subfamily)